MTLHIESSLEDARWAGIANLDGLLRRAFTAAAAEARPAASGELSVLLADDARLRQLNRTFRGKDEATNVLSFPPARAGTPAAGAMIGDIAISYDAVAREARRDNKVFEDHLAHLAVHGLLHLFGYDHEHDADAQRMEGLERRILAGLGIADPYMPEMPELNQIDAN